MNNLIVLVRNEDNKDSKSSSSSKSSSGSNNSLHYKELQKEVADQKAALDAEKKMLLAKLSALKSG